MDWDVQAHQGLLIRKKKKKNVTDTQNDSFVFIVERSVREHDINGATNPRTSRQSICPLSLSVSMGSSIPYVQCGKCPVFGQPIKPTNASVAGKCEILVFL